jgi:hypothetical protein
LQGLFQFIDALAAFIPGSFGSLEEFHRIFIILLLILLLILHLLTFPKVPKSRLSGDFRNFPVVPNACKFTGS